MRSSEILHQSDTRTWTLWAEDYDYGDWLQHDIRPAWGISFREEDGNRTTTATLRTRGGNQPPGACWSTREKAMEFWQGLLDAGMDPDTAPYADIPAHGWNQMVAYPIAEWKRMKAAKR